MQIVTVVVASAAAIAALLWAWFHWTRTRKSWCVILYHVSRDSNATFQWPNMTGGPQNDTLDEKLDQVVGEIESLPCGSLITFLKASFLGQQSSPGGVNWEDVHVVYRAVWNDHPIRPAGKPTTRARVVSWRPGAPRYQDDQSFATTADPDDRTGFFQWAYDNCPADHYAVFFWGHSIGPGGLFELSSSVAFPPLPAAYGFMPASLIDVEATIQLLFDQRNNLYAAVGSGATLPAGPVVPPPGGGGGGSTTPPSAGGPPNAGAGAPGLGTPPSKIEIVLFQDCWMSTLETAFELKDITRYVVASQSLVPIGYEYDANQVFVGPLGPVWPYTDLVSALLSNPTQFAAPVLVTLQNFFDQKVANRLPSLDVPFTLLDLGQSNEIAVNLTPSLQTLVAELAPLQKNERFALFKNNYIVKFNANNDLEAGEWALLDVRKLCEFLVLPSSYTSFNPPNATQIQNAAAAILTVVAPLAITGTTYSLVKQVFESPTVGGGAPLGFNGLSALWIPGKRSETPPGDLYLATQIDRAFYDRLKFVTETAMTAAPGKQWSDYAFERKI